MIDFIKFVKSTIGLPKTVSDKEFSDNEFIDDAIKNDIKIKKYREEQSKTVDYNEFTTEIEPIVKSELKKLFKQKDINKKILNENELLYVNMGKTYSDEERVQKCNIIDNIMNALHPDLHTNEHNTFMSIVSDEYKCAIHFTIDTKKE